MFLQTKLKRTVQIVENRLAETTSENPVRDLMFLAEHYHSSGELDKASAASRHLLRVAEGESMTKFEVTPLDVELLIDKKRHQEMRSKKLRPFLLSFLVVELMVLTAAGISPYISHEKMANIYVALCPWSCDALVKKARFEIWRQDWTAATAHCDQALLLKPGNKEAYRLKAEIALAQNDLETALRFIELCDANNLEVVDLKSHILFRQGDYESSARLPLAAISSGIARKNPYTAAGAAYSFAYAGKYDAALAAAKQQEDWSTSTRSRREAQVSQSQMLLKLGRYAECIRTASDVLADESKPWLRIYSRAYLYRAEAKFALHDSAGALDDINHSMATEIFSRRQYEMRIAALFGLGRTAEANAAIRDAGAFARFEML